MSTMAAVRVHGWGRPPVVDQVPRPDPGEDEALVRIEAAAVGHLDRTVAGGSFDVKPELPYVGGVEGCGTVVSAASLTAGTRVILRGGGLGLRRDGTWAEYVRVPEKNLMVVPEGMGPALGATYFVPLTTAAAALRSIGRMGHWTSEIASAEDEVVLVGGAAGAVGSMVAQLASSAGARVLGLVLDQEQADRLPGGVEPILSDDAERLTALDRDRSATLLVDTLGGAQLTRRMAWVRPGGRAVLIGYVTGEEATLDLPNWLLQDVALLPTNMIRRHKEARAYAEQLAPRLTTGELTLDVEEFEFHDAPRVFELMAEGRIRGRAVLRPPLE